MTEMVDCPAEGCDYGPYPPSTVAGHHGGTKDDAHAGGYQACMDLLTAETDRDADPDGRQEPAPAPTGGESGSQVDPPTPAEPPEPEEPACPECGETDFFDPAKHGYDGPRDRGCPTCSTEEEWVLYDA